MKEVNCVKEIVYNYDKLNEIEVDETVIRIKAVIINSKNELMLGYCDKTYQFPGGHLEDNETLEEGLVREVKEETGIDISGYSLKPFVKTVYYTRNYRNTGKNRKNEIYFYKINTDENWNPNNMNLDQYEKENNYTIKMIPLKEVKSVLNNSIKDKPINEIIVREMFAVLDTIEALQ